MSLAIYLDDCAFSHKLRQLLQDAGHEVIVPADVEPSLTGADDETHFAFASENQLVLLTYNSADFLALHDSNPNHAGIFAVYQDNDVTKDMSYRDIVRAIQNLQKIDARLNGSFWVLNAYRW